MQPGVGNIGDIAQNCNAICHPPCLQAVAEASTRALIRAFSYC